MKNATIMKLVPKKKERPRIQLIERKPRPEWFAHSISEHGATQLWIRIETTGLHPRRYGPFKTKRRALLFLDDFLQPTLDGYCDAMNQHDRIVEIIEDELASAYRGQKKDRRGNRRQSATQGATGSIMSRATR